MAEPITIKTATVKQQPVLMILLWQILTLGIYGLWYWYRINAEYRDIGKAYGDDELANSNPVMSFLAIFPGAILIVPVFWTLATTSQRLRRVEGLAGVPEASQMNLVLYWVLALFTGLHTLYIQSENNRTWGIMQQEPGQVPSQTS